jgi:4-amino-4-deoxy-L-arabinose transferase-like glycosyltransferase
LNSKTQIYLQQNQISQTPTAKTQYWYYTIMNRKNNSEKLTFLLFMVVGVVVVVIVVVVIAVIGFLLFAVHWFARSITCLLVSLFVPLNFFAVGRTKYRTYLDRQLKLAQTPLCWGCLCL